MWWEVRIDGTLESPRTRYYTLNSAKEIAEETACRISREVTVVQCGLYSKTKTVITIPARRKPTKSDSSDE
jgi:hypothetical protein